MSIINELECLYFEIENEYASKEFIARTKGQIRKEAFWRRKRELNTHAYFLFVFTRLEDHIKVNSIKLINNKKTSIGHWKTKAIWVNTEEKKLHFKKRLGLLTETGQSDYNKIIKYYDARNKIAHGETISGITVAINMMDVFTDMKKYLKKLKS